MFKLRQPAAFLFLTTVLLLQAAGAVRADVALSAQACFQNMSPRGIYPIVVTVTNNGPSMQCEIVVQPISYEATTHLYDYPLDLPSGTVKTFLSYPMVSDGDSGVQATFKGSVNVQPALVSFNSVSEYGQTSPFQIGLVSDDTGGLESLRNLQESGQTDATTGQEITYSDCYSSPETAPDRAAGYTGMSEVVIGPGAERLSDDQWAALREYALGGGAVVLLGGAGSDAYLDTPGAQQLCPLNSLQETTVQNPPLGSIDGDETYQDVAIMSGSLTPGAEVALGSSSSPLITRKQFGAGVVSLVGYDPLDAPFVGGSNSRELWSQIVIDTKSRISSSALEKWTLSRMEQMLVSGSGEINPFRISLPPLETVAWIFLAYFVIVIPATYFLLRRLGKLEWAWVSSPVISVAFAFVFYLFTISLYHSALSRRTSGIITAVAGDPNARFSGITDMFFPRGGTYDVSVPGAELFEERAIDDDEYSPSSEGANHAPLETLDTPEGVLAPNYDVGNLAFRRFYHVEPVGLPGTISAGLSYSDGTNLAGTVSNSMSIPLTNVNVFDPYTGKFYIIGSLAPGQSERLPGQVTPSDGDADEAEPFSLLVSFLPYTSTLKEAPASAILMANAPAASLGPQLGRDVSGTDSVTILVSIPLRGGTNR